MLTESFGQAEIVQPADFAKILKEGRPVMVNVVPRGGNRGGAVKLDSPLSDSLAQPKPWKSRRTEEQAHEKDEKESRTRV